MTRSKGRTAVHPVHQARSRKTLNALLDALDQLLRERHFESITVLDLAQAAKVSTGAFYARFASKEDLLPELYSRYQRSLEDLTSCELDPSSWSPLSAAERLKRATRFLCDIYASRSWLMRAVAIHSRRSDPPAPGVDPGTTPQARLLQRLADCVGVAPALRDGLSRQDLEFALYTAMTLARETILFPHLPMAAALGLNARTIVDRLPILLERQLGLSSPDQERGCS